MRRRLIFYARSILLGWAVLLLTIYLLERPLLVATASLVGASWLPTARLALDCAALASTGWAIGRLSRPTPLPAVLSFAATLIFWDFGDLLEIKVPWLLRLVKDALGDSRYRGAVIDASVIQVLLFGSLVGGALLSRSITRPLSISRS